VVCPLYERAVAYYRVTTRQQHRSGLGIEAQRATVTRFAETENLQIIAEYVEAETGKGADALDRRPRSCPCSGQNRALLRPGFQARPAIA